MQPRITAQHVDERLDVHEHLRAREDREAETITSARFNQCARPQMKGRERHRRPRA